jgi:hypothetical protein
MVRAAIVSDAFRSAVRLHLVEEGTEVRVQGMWFRTRTIGAPRIQNLLYRLLGIYLLLRHWSEVYRVCHLRASPSFDTILDVSAVYHPRKCVVRIFLPDVLFQAGVTQPAAVLGAALISCHRHINEAVP